MIPFKSVFALIALCSALAGVHFRRPTHAYRIGRDQYGLQRRV